jgi:hypothetical protein
VKDKAMALENGMISVVISSSVMIGFVGFVFHTVWKGYQEFRKYVYENMTKKEDCKDLREACKELRTAGAGRRKDG